MKAALRPRKVTRYKILQDWVVNSFLLRMLNEYQFMCILQCYEL